MWLFKIFIFLNLILSVFNYEYSKDNKKYYFLFVILELLDVMWEKFLDNLFLKFYIVFLFFK